MFTYLFGSTGYTNALLYRLGLLATPIDWLGGGWRACWCSWGQTSGK